MGSEKYVYMIFVMVPFFKSDVIVGGDIFKYLFRPVGNIFIENLSAIFGYKHRHGAHWLRTCSGIDEGLNNSNLNYIYNNILIYIINNHVLL